MIQNSKFKIQNYRKGFTLIELLVAIAIFALVLVGMMAVFNAALGSFQKGRAVKKVMEDSQFALNSISKDVRMGKIENYYKVGVGSTVPLSGSLENYFVVTRNRGGKVCYRIDDNTIGISEGIDSENTCPSDSNSYKNLVDLTNSGMSFNLASSGFYSCPSFFGIATNCPSAAPNEKRRGWVEINLDIGVPSMETDTIKIQTIVSSRDYGWEDAP